MVTSISKVKNQLFLYIIVFKVKMDIYFCPFSIFFDFRLEKIKNHFLRYFIFVMINAHELKNPVFGA